jgi:hypothetical protein
MVHTHTRSIPSFRRATYPSSRCFIRGRTRRNGKNLRRGVCPGGCLEFRGCERGRRSYWMGSNDSGRRGERLAVGTRDGGVLVYDVVSGQIVSDQEPSSHIDGSNWAALTHIRGASRPLQSLGSYKTSSITRFVYIPAVFSSRTAKRLDSAQGRRRVCRYTQPSPKIAAASRAADAALVLEDSQPHVSLSQLRNHSLKHRWILSC